MSKARKKTSRNKPVRCPHCGRSHPLRESAIHLRWCPLLPTGARNVFAADEGPTKQAAPIPAAAARQVRVGYTNCANCHCLLRLNNIPRHASVCPKRSAVASRTTPRVVRRSPPPSAPLDVGPRPLKPPPHREPAPSRTAESQRAQTGVRPYVARPYVVGTDGTVHVLAKHENVAASHGSHAIGSLRTENDHSSDIGLGDDARDATRYSGHSFRDQKGRFGSHAIYDAFDDESEPK